MSKVEQAATLATAISTWEEASNTAREAQIKARYAEEDLKRLLVKEGRMECLSVNRAAVYRARRHGGDSNLKLVGKQPALGCEWFAEEGGLCTWSL